MTKEKKLMLPKWLKFNWIPQRSIGWNMGSGEHYAIELYNWLETLTKEELEEYNKLFPRPICWPEYKKNDERYDVVYKYTYNKEWLLNNEDNEYLFFWGHRPSKDGLISKSCLSQWWMCKFKIGVEEFCCMEQYMMFRKAWLFRDEEIAKEIMKSDDPSKIKALGRKVSNFDEKVWNEHKYNIVVEGNYYKFIQNQQLLNFLFSTKNKVLVEASPFDNIWGVGMGVDDENINDPTKWRGENLLGFALMEVRKSIKEVIKNKDLATNI